LLVALSFVKAATIPEKRIKGYDKSGNIAHSSKYLAGERERERANNFFNARKSK
jgi:hypothetical protein